MIIDSSSNEPDSCSNDCCGQMAATWSRSQSQAPWRFGNFVCSPLLPLLSMLMMWSFLTMVAGDQEFKFIPNSNDHPYSCGVSLICLGSAHVGQDDGNRTFNGRLSLISEKPLMSTQNSGLAYYREPIRMLDPGSGKATSFTTNFTINQVMEMYTDFNNKYAGDGMTFVLSEDKTRVGGSGWHLGIFTGGGSTDFKTIVVEFDNYMNPFSPTFDINHNHVSLDFSNITSPKAANVTELGIYLWYNQTTYVWVDYSAETKLMEVRVANTSTKPARNLLNYTVDLKDVATEYMYAGFSAGNGDHWSHYYVGNWSFSSYGIEYRQPHGKSRKYVRLGIILAVALGGVVLAGVLSCCLIWGLRRHPKVKEWRLGDYVEEETLGLYDNVVRRVTYKHLSAATKAFGDESKLGEGGFGSVYKGVLPITGTHIAVKKISPDSNQGEREFMTEVSIISQLRHRNLIELLGWCKEQGKYLLVYDLMPNGSLDKALFLPAGAPNVLSWKQRFNIVIGTARALDYLHQGFKQQVIHRDVKSSNIMLDGEWNARLGDFGLARLVDHLKTAPTTMVAGTYGYIAPEAASGRFTEKTDVFAFGAVVLEVACGRKSLNVHAPLPELVLVDWVWEHLAEGSLLSVVDKRLVTYDSYWMEVILLLGLLCSHPDPTGRPSMRHVVQVLSGEVPVPPVPSVKPSASFNSDYRKVTIGDIHQSRSSSSLFSE